MSLPFALPDWLPWWVPLAVLLPLALYALAFFAMPFSVLGLKGRMEAIEGRLDEIQGEIRGLALRLPEPVRGGREPARDAARVPSPAEGEPPVLPRVLAERRSETAIPPMPPRTQPVPPLVVPIPPANHDLAAAPRRFVPPVTRAEPRGRGDRPGAGVPEPQSGRRSEPRIDWPR